MAMTPEEVRRELDIVNSSEELQSRASKILKGYGKLIVLMLASFGVVYWWSTKD